MSEFVSMNAEQIAIMAKAVDETYARRVVEALHAAGKVIVDREPNAQAVLEGMKAHPTIDAGYVEAIYRAMTSQTGE